LLSRLLNKLRSPNAALFPWEYPVGEVIPQTPPVTHSTELVSPRISARRITFVELIKQYYEAADSRIRSYLIKKGWSNVAN